MHPAKQLTASEAFRRIGKQIEKEGHIWSGLCYEVSRLHWDDIISFDTRYAMLQAIDGYLMEMGTFAYGEFGGDEPMARAMAAYWLALDAQAEAR